MARRHYDTKILTDGNYDTKKGFGVPGVVVIRDGEYLEGVFFGFGNFRYPSSMVSECAATSLGIYVATNFCDTRNAPHENGRAVVKNDNSEIVRFFNGGKIENNDRESQEMKNLLEVSLMLKKRYKIDVKHTKGEDVLPDHLSREIRTLFLKKAEEYKQTVTLI
ncbi:MAG: hypothetical protein V1818_01625 [Candidatus Aenigmatarchaeota archaeon]